MAQVLPIPEQIGRYQILSELGRGAMGRVFLAQDPVIERHVALKVMAAWTEIDAEAWSEMQERFLLEARAAGRVRHPGVVTIYDADRDRETDTSYIAMEWIDGQSLQDLIKGCAPLRATQAVPIIEQVALALHAAHENDMVHRDVKPANILLDAEGTAKLTDFGITKLSTVDLTAAGTVLGSPTYMSPEQVRNDDIDGRSDLFSLGVVLFECLTGTTPFHGDSLATVTYNILELDPLSSDELQERIGTGLCHIVRRAIEKDRSKRFQNGYEFAQALRATEADTPTQIGPHGTQMLVAGSLGQIRAKTGKHQPVDVPKPSRSLRSLGWLLALVVILSVAVGVPTYRSQSEAPEPDQPGTNPQSSTTPADTSAAITTSPVETTAEESAPVLSATLAIQYKNRLKAGFIAVFVDGERVWYRSLKAQGGVFKRASGESIEGIIPVDPGRHMVEVRITGAEKKVDVGKRLEGVFHDGSTRTLRVGLVPKINKLKISWKE